MPHSARGAEGALAHADTERCVRARTHVCAHTCRLAYDGKGNAVVKSEADFDAAVQALGGYEQGLYAEKWAPFVKELAVMVVRWVCWEWG